MNMNSSNETNFSHEASPGNDNFDEAIKENESFKTVGNTNINKTQTVSECHNKGVTNCPNEPQKGDLSIATNSLLETSSKEALSAKKDNDKNFNENEPLQQKNVENIHETPAIPERLNEKEALQKESNKNKYPESMQKVQSFKDSLPEQSSDNPGNNETEENTPGNNSLDSKLKGKESLHATLVGYLHTNGFQAASECPDGDEEFSKALHRTETVQESQNVYSNQSINDENSEFNEHALEVESSHTRGASVLLSPERLGSSSSLTRRRPISSRQTDDVLSATIVIDEENEVLSNVPHYKRRKIFNMVKHVVSIVLIVLDVIFDWIEYDEMNSRGTYEIAEERQVNNIKITYKCEGTGETIQLVYMIFTIIGTLISVGQICNIVYQIVHERKNKFIEKRLVHEYIETFVLLFFIKISQLLLIMGFFDVCTLDCTIDVTEILISLNITISFTRISWRWFTSCKCCTIYWKTPPKRRQSTRTSIDSQHWARTPSVSSRRSQRSLRTPMRGRSHDQRGCCSDINCEGCICLLAVILFPLLLPFLPFIAIYLLLKNCSCPCDTCSNRVQASEVEREKFKCERSCKCCILRCFPSRFEEPDTDACECTCKTCLACERSCKCFLCRCFPSYLPHKAYNVFECLCGQCLTCEQNCRCCILRCFPSYQQPPEDDFCTCNCSECMACEIPCKCFTFRCCPTYLSPQKSDIWTCRCSECMACEVPCKCFTFRCCPTHLSSPKTDIWTCSCRECLACALPCKCFIFRCFPEFLKNPHPDICTCLCSQCLSCALPCPCCVCRCFPEHQGETDWFNCTCGKCIACEKSCCCCVCRICPSELDPPKQDIFQCLCKDICTCCKSTAVAPRPIPISTITTQPRLPIAPPPPYQQIIQKPVQPRPRPVVIQPQPLPPPRLPTPPSRLPTPKPPRQKCSCKKCLECLSKCQYFFIAVCLLFLILLYLFYLCLIGIQLQYVLVCTVNETVMETTQVILVRSFVSLF